MSSLHVSNRVSGTNRRAAAFVVLLFMQGAFLDVANGFVVQPAEAATGKDWMMMLQTAAAMSPLGAGPSSRTAMFSPEVLTREWQAMQQQQQLFQFQLQQQQQQQQQLQQQQQFQQQMLPSSPGPMLAPISPFQGSNNAALLQMQTQSASQSQAQLQMLQAMQMQTLMANHQGVPTGFFEDKPPVALQAAPEQEAFPQMLAQATLPQGPLSLVPAPLMSLPPAAAAQKDSLHQLLVAAGEVGSNSSGARASASAVLFQPATLATLQADSSLSPSDSPNLGGGVQHVLSLAAAAARAAADTVLPSWHTSAGKDAVASPAAAIQQISPPLESDSLVEQRLKGQGLTIIHHGESTPSSASGGAARTGEGSGSVPGASASAASATLGTGGASAGSPITHAAVAAVGAGGAADLPLTQQLSKSDDSRDASASWKAEDLMQPKPQFTNAIAVNQLPPKLSDADQPRGLSQASLDAPEIKELMNLQEGKAKAERAVQSLQVEYMRLIQHADGKNVQGHQAGASQDFLPDFESQHQLPPSAVAHADGSDSTDISSGFQERSNLLAQRDAHRLSQYASLPQFSAKTVDVNTVGGGRMQEQTHFSQRETLQSAQYAPRAQPPLQEQTQFSQQRETLQSAQYAPRAQPPLQEQTPFSQQRETLQSAQHSPRAQLSINALDASRGYDVASSFQQRPEALQQQDAHLEEASRFGQAQSSFSACTPQCSWQCDSPKCDEVCEPVCQAPKCETRCMGTDTSGCGMECENPQCAVVCPKKQCASGGCPQCQSTCSEPRCKLSCPRQQPCRNVCEHPECQWSCKAPAQCPAPRCRLVCESPKSCMGQTYVALPPLQPGETSVQSFASPVETLHRPASSLSSLRGGPTGDDPDLSQITSSGHRAQAGLSAPIASSVPVRMVTGTHHQEEPQWRTVEMPVMRMQ